MWTDACVSNTSREKFGQAITCKGPGKPLVMEEVIVAPSQKMEVRIKILYTSICHTDISGWKGENKAQRIYSRILGHEATGIIESVGEGVTNMKTGDHVIPIFARKYGECACCKNEKTNLCRNFEIDPFRSTMVNDGKCRFSTMNGDPIFHFMNTSTFSEYTVLDHACLVKIGTKFSL